MATVTKPVNILVPVVEEKIREPLAPLPTVVVPTTVKLSAPSPTVKVLPSRIERLPLIVKLVLVVAIVPVLGLSIVPKLRL